MLLCQITGSVALRVQPNHRFTVKAGGPRHVRIQLRSNAKGATAGNWQMPLKCQLPSPTRAVELMNVPFSGDHFYFIIPREESQRCTFPSVRESTWGWRVTSLLLPLSTLISSSNLNHFFIHLILLF